MNSSNQEQIDDSVTQATATLEFFKLYGSSETVKQGQVLFAQGQQKTGLLSFLQNNKTYLVLNGDIVIQTVSKQISHLTQGQLFGEFTPFVFNNATATANTACQLYTLTEKQLLQGLKKCPEFLFILSKSLFKYLEEIDPKSEDALLLVEHESFKHIGVLDDTLLNTLKEKLGDNALMVVPEKRVVCRTGGAALLLYVILDGYMVIFADNKVVNRSGRGDVVGEIALISPNHARTASVVAETRCSLLAMNQQTLLETIQALPSFALTLLRIAVAHLHNSHRVTK